MFNTLRRSSCLRRDSIFSCVSLFYTVEKDPPKWSRSFSTNAKERSFPVTYLIQTLGFSSESATIASKYLNFKTPDNPNSVLAFLKDRGFSHTQICKLIRSHPKFLVVNPLKILLPKLEFLYSKGVSISDVAEIVTKDPTLLAMSLDKKLIPSFNFLVGLFKSEIKTLVAVKRAGTILRLCSDSPAVCNLEFLRECGVPDAKILNMFCAHPWAFSIRVDRFKNNVEEVMKLGFVPKTSKFMMAVTGLNSFSETAWERKVDVYRKSGWSEQELLSAFRKHPCCMAVSEEKILAVMDFFRTKMDMEPLVIARHPVALTLSLEKRVIPRASVAQVLVSRGLLKKDFNLTAALAIAEDAFVDRYILAHKQEVPHLLQLYRDKLALAAQHGKR